MAASVSVRLKNASVSKKMPLNIHIQWNAGTACFGGLPREGVGAKKFGMSVET